MPTVLRQAGYRVYFTSHDVDEPPHVHVDAAGKSAKFWLEPVRNEENFGFAANELTKIEALISENKATLIRKWHEFFRT